MTTVLEPAERAYLRQFLVDHFSLDDLLDIAFDLGVDSELFAYSAVRSLARDLIERFQDPALDSTIGIAGAGLFTDGTGPFDPLDEIGIATRISVNPAVDPAAGGAAWRLRDGIGAATAGEVGNSTLISALADRVSERRIAASGPSAGLSRSLSALASDVLSGVDLQQRQQEDARAFHAARADALASEIAEDGVDTAGIRSTVTSENPPEPSFSKSRSVPSELASTRSRSVSPSTSTSAVSTMKSPA